MKIFNLDDVEFWIGESLESCVDEAMRTCGTDAEDYESAHELSDADLDRMKFQDTDEDDRPLGEPRTFREQMAREIAEGGAFPRLFAVNDY